MWTSEQRKLVENEIAALLKDAGVQDYKLAVKASKVSPLDYATVSISFWTEDVEDKNKMIQFSTTSLTNILDRAAVKRYRNISFTASYWKDFVSFSYDIHFHKSE